VVSPITVTETVHVDRIPVAQNAWIFGFTAPGPMLEWEWAHQRLRAARNFWIATGAPDGSPHTRPIWGFWQDGGFWFCTTNRSVPYIETNNRVFLHTESGDEVVIVEGRCDRLHGKENNQIICDGYKSKYDHDTVAEDDGLYTPEGYGGPGFKITPIKVLGWIAPQFNTATRWNFPE
jgi:hypothetical protein